MYPYVTHSTVGGGDFLKMKQHSQSDDREKTEDGNYEGGHHDVGVRDVQKWLG